jgi:multiple sugar transport system permease protein
VSWHNALTGRLSRRYRMYVAPLAFIAPSVLLLLVFRVLPIFQSAQLSMTEFKVLNPALSRFVGLDNYVRLFQDKYVAEALWNTVYYSVGSVVPGMLISLLYALVITERWFKFQSFARVIFFLPHVLSITIAALIFSWMYHPSFGLFNFLLSKLGLPDVPWLASPYTAMPSVIIMVVWRGLGYNVTIWSAGLLSIPLEYRDAAKIDGASWLKEFLHVRFPMLRPVFLFLAVLGFLGTFQGFESIYVLTHGGPVNVTRVIVFYLYQNAFQWMEMGYASAIAWILFMILVSLTYLQFKTMGRHEAEG